jgi:probable HAF family extracellular repeat protein
MKKLIIAFICLSLILIQASVVRAGNVFLWEDSQWTEVNPKQGMQWAYPWSINNVGQIAGSARDSSGRELAVVWQNGTMTELSTPVGSWSLAKAINNSG